MKTAALVAVTLVMLDLSWLHVATFLFAFVFLKVYLQKHRDNRNTYKSHVVHHIDANDVHAVHIHHSFSAIVRTISHSTVQLCSQRLPPRWEVSLRRYGAIAFRAKTKYWWFRPWYSIPWGCWVHGDDDCRSQHCTGADCKDIRFSQIVEQRSTNPIAGIHSQWTLHLQWDLWWLEDGTCFASTRFQSNQDQELRPTDLGQDASLCSRMIEFQSWAQGGTCERLAHCHDRRCGGFLQYGHGHAQCRTPGRQWGQETQEMPLNLF